MAGARHIRGSEASNEMAAMHSKYIASLLYRLQNQHWDLESLLQHLDADRYLQRPAPGKWNIHDQLAHLARYQEVFLNRVHQIIHHNAVPLKRYIAEEDPEFEPFRMRTEKELWQQIVTARKQIYELLSKLPEKQLQQTGIHEKYGPLTLVQWTEFFLLHEAHHIYAIFQLSLNKEPASRPGDKQ